MDIEEINKIIEDCIEIGDNDSMINFFVMIKKFITDTKATIDKQEKEIETLKGITEDDLPF